MESHHPAQPSPGIVRIGSNFLRLFSTFIIGLLLVRLLLQLGNDAFGVIALLGAGTGIARTLREVVRASLVPKLGAAYHSKLPGEFGRTYNSAMLLSVCAAGITVVAFCGLALLLPQLKIPASLLTPAIWFVGAKATQMFFVICLAPIFNMYLVSERMVWHNFWTVADRVTDLLAAIGVLAMWGHADPGMAVAWYGILTAILGTVSLFVSCLGLMKLERAFVPSPASASLATARTLLGSAGWNSLVVLSMNLFIPVDMVIMNSAFGVMGNLVFGIANQLTSYVRMLTMGLVAGLDAVAARVANVPESQAVKNLIIRSGRIQSLLVFPATLLLLIFAEPVIRIWISQRVDNPASTLPLVVALTRILILGVAARSLSEGWMWVLSGAGRVSSYAPWLLPGAIANPIIAVLAIYLFPQSVSYLAPACVYSAITIIVHLVVLPFIVASEVNCRLSEIYTPLVRPMLVSLISLAPLTLAFWVESWTAGIVLVFSGMYLGVYSLVAFCIGLTNAERRRVLQFMRTVVSRLISVQRTTTEKRMSSTLAERILIRTPLFRFLLPALVIEITSRIGGALCGVFFEDKAFAAERRLRGLLSASRFRAAGLRIGRGARFEASNSISLGNNVTIHGGSHLVATRHGKISIADDTHIGINCVLSGPGGIQIGRGCAISSQVTIYSVTNHYLTDPTKPILENEVVLDRVIIGDDVWVGAGAVILPGISVADHAVIGAGAVVTKDVEAWQVVVGAPAQVLKDRRDVCPKQSNTRTAA